MPAKHIASRALAAFVLALVLAPAQPLVAQQLFASTADMSRRPRVQTAERASPDTGAVFTKKYEATASALSDLLPGGGQFYAGKPVKGMILLGVTAGGVAHAFACHGDGPDFTECLPNLLVGSLAVLTGWTISRVTAAGDAREYNEKHANSVAIEPLLERHVGRTGLGLALRY